MFRVGLIIVATALVAALIGPSLAPFDSSAQTLALRLDPPSSTHLFGLDEAGRMAWRYAGDLSWSKTSCHAHAELDGSRVSP